MIQKNQKWYKLFEILAEHQNKEFSIRELSEKSKIPSASVQRYIVEMKKLKLLDKRNKLILDSYSKFLKTFYFIEKMHKIGLINHLELSFNASVIVLFGSVRKGEYDNESDVDIFIESTKDIELDLKKYETLLGHKIELFVKKSIQELPSHLYNNVINGIKLSGYLKAK